LWIGIASALVLAFLCAYFVSFPITDTDIWWHLAAGRFMAENQGWIRFDPFSRLSQGVPWIDLHWGFQWLVYRIWLLGERTISGPFSLVLAKGFAAGLLAIACWWPALLLRPASLSRRLWILAWIFPWAIALGYHQRYLTDIRPLWLTLILLSLQYTLSKRFLASRSQTQNASPTRERFIIGLGLASCQIAMANIQGLFLLGPILMSVFFFGEGMRSSVGNLAVRLKTSFKLFPWKLMLVLCLANGCNPYGLASLKLAFTVAGRIVPTSGNIFSSEMAENLPLWDSLAQNPRYFLPLVLTWMAALALALACWRNPRQRYWGEALVHLACAILACMAQRNIPFALVSLSWWLARIAIGLDIRAWTWHKPAMVGLWLALLPAGSWAAMEIREGSRFELPGSWITPFRLPLGAVEWISKHRPEGQLFNELRHGGYLAWTFADPQKNFIDGRMVLRSGEQFREFLNAFDQPQTFASLQRRYGITHVVLPLLEWDRYRQLGAYLLRTGNMELAYCDGATALLVQHDIGRFDWVAHGGDSASTTAPVIHEIREIDDAVQRRFSANPLLARIASRSARDFLAEGHWRPPSN
jgi:hypothetical protein